MTDHNNINSNNTNNQSNASYNNTEKHQNHPQTRSLEETKRRYGLTLASIQTQTCEGYLRKKCVLVYWVKNPNTNAPQAVPKVWKYVSRYFFVVGDTLCYTKTKKDREKRKKYKVITHLTQIKELATTQTKIQIVVHTGHQINLKSNIPEDIARWVQFLAPFKSDSSPTNNVTLTNFPAQPRSRITTLSRFPLPVISPDIPLTTNTTTTKPADKQQADEVEQGNGMVPYTPDLRKAVSTSHAINSPAYAAKLPAKSASSPSPIRSTPPVPSRPTPPTPSRVTPTPPNRPIPPIPSNISTTHPPPVRTNSTLAAPISSPNNSSPPLRPSSPQVLNTTSPSLPPTTRIAAAIPRLIGRPAAPVPPRPNREGPISPRIQSTPNMSFSDNLIDETMPWKETGTLRPYKPHEHCETYIPYDQKTDEEKALSNAREKERTPERNIVTSWSMNNIAEWDDHDTSISSDATAIMGWDDWDAIFIKSQSLENISHLTSVN